MNAFAILVKFLGGIFVSETSFASDVKMEPEWKNALLPEFGQEYMQGLKRFLMAEKKLGKVIFPKGPDIFKAFDETPLSKVKVVIIGQDPYHGAGQAHGLSFSVPAGVLPPPSLKNIFKEIEADLGLKLGPVGDLRPWAKQGVLLLNAVLTVEQGVPASHKERGWERFTDRVIEVLNNERSNLVFMLWGRYAQVKGLRIDRTKHLVLESAHPSPFSATKFFGQHHFSQANAYLKSHGIAPIDWSLQAGLPESLPN